MMSATKRILRIAAGLALVGVLTAVAYLVHWKPFTVGFIYLLPVMVIAFQWGFLEAAIVSIAAIGCLDYYFTEPLFTLYQQDPQDWIALAFFEAIALITSHLANRLEHHAERAEKERSSAERLYRLSREIIMIERSAGFGAQLAQLMLDTFPVKAVAIWDAREGRFDKAGTTDDLPEWELREIYLSQLSENDSHTGKYSRVLKIGATPIGSFHLVLRPDGETFDPKAVDAIASLASITLERAHSFIAESNAEAGRRSERLRTTVLDGLAHTFKTPLAVIESASSGLLEIDSLRGAERELVSLIDQEAQHLTALTNQILRMAKLDDELKINYVTIHLDELLDVCKSHCAHILNGHPLVLIDEADRGMFSADLQLVGMALAQLLDNASKYSTPESPITLHVRASDSDVQLAVHNKGSYIADDERSRIFERFYRSPETRYKTSGTGIGLSVTLRIAEAHGGTISVESDPDTGTTFSLTLPQRRNGA